MSRLPALASLVLASAVLAACQSISPPSPPRIQSPRKLVEQKCSTCHAIDLVDTSPNPHAPPLRDLFRRYPVDSLGAALLNGLKVGHYDMPRFTLDPGEMDAILSYLRSLDPCARPASDAPAMRRCFAPMEIDRQAAPHG